MAIILLGAAGYYFGYPYYTVYSAKRDLEKIGIPFSEQKFVEKACDGDEGSVLLFLQGGMNVNLLAAPGKKDGVAKSALHCAAMKGSIPMAQALVAAGANINLKDDDSNTPLYYAAKIIKNQASQDQSATGLEMVKFLVAKGADVNATSDAGTALIVSLQANSHEVTDYLLDHKADAKLNGKDKITPIMSFVSRAYGTQPMEIKNIIAALVKAGCDINATNKQGQSALGMAVNTRQQPLIKALIEAGANPNTEDAQGNTVITYAMYDPETFKMLLDNGADINVKSQAGTILHQAVLQQNQQILQIILASKKIDINTKNGAGETALHLAASRNNPIVAQQLILNGADVNVTNNNFETPLIKASMVYAPEVAKTLIEWNANVNARDSRDKTALYYAKQRADARGYSVQNQYSGDALTPAPVAQTMAIYPGAYNPAVVALMRKRMEDSRTSAAQQSQARVQQPADPLVDMLTKHGAHL